MGHICAVWLMARGKLYVFGMGGWSRHLDGRRAHGLVAATGLVGATLHVCDNDVALGAIPGRITQSYVANLVSLFQVADDIGKRRHRYTD